MMYLASFVLALALLFCSGLGSQVHEVEWTIDGVRQYRNTPLRVFLGDTVLFLCANDSFSNIVYQSDRLQYDNCDVTASSGASQKIGECLRSAFRVGAREEIKQRSETLPNAISYEAGVTVYFTSYSDGSFDSAVRDVTAGGECVDGLKMEISINSAPPAPEVVTIDGTGLSWIAVSWQHSTVDRRISAYVIMVVGGGMEWNVTTDGIQTSINVTGLQPDTQYRVTVVSVTNDEQMSPPSIALVTATNPLPVLVAPEDLRVDVVASYWISISWTQSPMNRDISGHIILLSGGGRTWNVTGDSSETSIRVTGLQPDTEYQMRVVAVATDGRTSPPSDQITATTLTALEVFFIKNTPQIQGGKNGVVYAELTSNRPNTVFRCHIKRFNTAEDCSSGIYTRTDIPPGRYVLNVVGTDPGTGDRDMININFLLKRNEEYCAVHPVNHSWRVEGRSFTVEFSATGKPSGFICALNTNFFSACTSPWVLTDLSPGRHTVRIIPQGCSRYARWQKYFNIK